jgi:hypothetical protein
MPREEDRRLYDALVQRIAAGRTISQVEIDAVLARVGMTHDELRQDINILKKGETNMGLIERLKEHGANALGAYKSLVQRVAAGEEPDDKEARDILDAAGKGLGDLEADVSKARRIQELQQIIDSEAGLRDERIALQREQGEKLKRLVEEEREWAQRKLETEGAYSSKLAELERREERVIEAKRELFRLTHPSREKQPELPSWRPGFHQPLPGDLSPTEAKQDVS